MADTYTAYYNLTKVEVGASRDTWGAKLNSNADALDLAIHNVSALADNTSTALTTHVNSLGDMAYEAKANYATAAQGTLASTAVQPAGLTKAAVGLGNADNTSDANKPVSTATQAALNAKATLGAVALFNDVTASRGDGTGVVLLGDAAHYLYFDGAQYRLASGELLVNGSQVWHAGNFNPANKADTTSLKEIGVGQTWQNVTAGRVGNTSYQNTTGKPIIIAVTHGATGGAGPLQVSTDNVSWVDIAVIGINYTAYAVIPNGHYYKLVGNSVSNWAELR